MSGDEIDDRLSKRFDDETNDQTNDGQADTASRAQDRSQNVQSEESAQNAQNIKKAWNVRSFYLEDGLEKELTTAFKRLDLELDEAEADIKLQKTRHFYPLIVQLGLEQLEELDTEDIIEQLQESTTSP